jgi:alkylation response protein AidB-like acyl-CoA dehydrogenase
MSFEFTSERSFPELDEHRERIRAWLADHAPRDWRAAMRDASQEKYLAFEREWLKTLHEGSLAVPHWPSAYGGCDYTLAERIVLYEEMVRIDAPQPHLHRVAINHAAETLLRHGTEEQRRFFLPRILEGDIWCQGFSEPGAGSDLAALSTRAERGPGEYVVNGQKTWSSYAEFASWSLLLVRTDPSAPKRKGISMLLLDLSSPGVEVRPIRQITGETEFCEIFMTDVAVPADRLVGEENAGWLIAQTTLATERGIGVVGLQQQLARAFEFLVQTAEQRPTPNASRALDDPAVRETLVTLYSEIEGLRMMCHRMLTGLVREGRAGPEASVIKLFYSELLQRLSAFGVELDGLGGQLERPVPKGASWTSGNWIVDHLKSWAWTIGGGTSEIQRTMIGERVLGLPREPVAG